MWDFLFSFARPPLACSSRFACFGLFPRPLAWEARATTDLRLRALRRSVCLLPCCAALSLPLVRYSGAVRLRAVLLGCSVDAVPPSSSSACSSLAGGWCDAWFCVLLVSSVSGSTRFPFPRSAILPAGRGGERSMCGELGETARVPMIGWCRFSFSRHLIFDTG